MSGLKRVLVGLTVANIIVVVGLINGGCTSTMERNKAQYEQIQQEKQREENKEKKVAEEVVEEETVEEEVTKEEATEEVVEETKPKMFSEDGITFPAKKYITWTMLEKYERSGVVEVHHNDKDYTLKLDKDSIDLLKRINDKIDSGRIKHTNLVSADDYISTHGGFPDNATWHYIKTCLESSLAPSPETIGDLLRYDNGIL